MKTFCRQDDLRVVSMARRVSTTFVGITNRKKKPKNHVHLWISIILGIGSFLIIIGVGGSARWSEESGIWNFNIHEFDLDEYNSTRFFAIFGMLSSTSVFILSICQIKFKQINENQTADHIYIILLTLSFISILLALWIWGDLVRHLKEVGLKKKNPFNKKDTYIYELYELFSKSTQDKSLANKWNIGWSYWLTVAGELNLFVANLLFFMKKDFEKIKCVDKTEVEPEIVI